LALAQFMLPGEAILYESPGEVYYRRTPHTLLVTGERLLLHAFTGVFRPRERVVAEPLSEVRHLEYSEEGLLSKRARLDVRFPDETISLTGETETIKDVWRVLQMQTLTPAPGAADDEVTLVVPPPPLFDDLPDPPAQVERLPVAGPRRSRPAFGTRSALALGAVCVLALAAAAVLLLGGRQRTTAPPPEARLAASPTPPAPTPAPTPVQVHVMDETFTLDEGSHRAVRFTVPEGAEGARVSGGFRVTSGSYIDFYVMSEAQYDRFATGGPPDVTSVVYREEQWNARVGERLPPGSYYLVFDNRDYNAQVVAAEFFVAFGLDRRGGTD
jgi:hypothetical protein